MKIISFENQPLDSNCYVIEESHRAIVVDPGNNYIKPIANHIISNDLSLDYIILTHEHIDHVQGVRQLSERFSAAVIASSACFASLSDPRLNLSADYPGVTPQDYTPSRAITIESLTGELTWNNNNFRFYPTPGHSRGSICFVVADSLFSGDTLLEKIKTYTTSPNSSIESLRKSFDIIKSLIPNELTVYPGHGSNFALADVEPFIDTQIRLLDRKIARQHNLGALPKKD